MSNSDDDKLAEFITKLAESQGVACATVDDGHVLLFKRSFLQELLDKNPAGQSDKVMIFVKRPDFKN